MKNILGKIRKGLQKIWDSIRFTIAEMISFIMYTLVEIIGLLLIVMGIIITIMILIIGFLIKLLSKRKFKNYLQKIERKWSNLGNRFRNEKKEKE